MLKLFISQPMGGLTSEEILQKRKEYKKYVEKIMGEEVEVIDSFFTKDPEDEEIKEKALWHLGESITLMSKADCVFFAKEWHRFRGCRVEHTCAELYELKKIYEQ